MLALCIIIVALLKGCYAANTAAAGPDGSIQASQHVSVGDVVSVPHAHGTISLQRGSPRKAPNHVAGQTVPVSGGILALGEYAAVLQVAFCCLCDVVLLMRVSSSLLLIVAKSPSVARLQIGAQLFHLQLDTGSATLAVPSTECLNCPLTIDRPYEPQLSMNYTQMWCRTQGCRVW